MQIQAVSDAAIVDVAHERLAEQLVIVAVVQTACAAQKIEIALPLIVVQIGAFRAREERREIARVAAHFRFVLTEDGLAGFERPQVGWIHVMGLLDQFAAPRGVKGPIVTRISDSWPPSRCALRSNRSRSSMGQARDRASERKSAQEAPFDSVIGVWMRSTPAHAGRSSRSNSIARASPCPRSEA